MNASIAKVQRSRNQQSGIPPVISRLLPSPLLSGVVDIDPRMNTWFRGNGTTVPVNRGGSLSRK